MSDKGLKQFLRAAKDAGVTHLCHHAQADRLAELPMPRTADDMRAYALASIAKQQASPVAQADAEVSFAEGGLSKVAFLARDLPIGTKLYAAPPSAPQAAGAMHDTLLAAIAKIKNLRGGELAPEIHRKISDAAVEELEELLQPVRETTTGSPPGMLQDDSRELSKALAAKPNAKQEVRDVCAEITAAQAEPMSVTDDGGKWEGAEEWMPLAWELCANECGEEACTELVWEGGPIPEPWGDRWLKYESQAREMIAMVRKHVPPLAEAGIKEKT